MAGNGSGATTRSRAHLTNKKPVLAKVDRSGSPTDLVTSSGAAEIRGYSSYRNLLHELIDNPDDTRNYPADGSTGTGTRTTVCVDGRDGNADASNAKQFIITVELLAIRISCQRL